MQRPQLGTDPRPLGTQVRQRLGPHRAVHWAHRPPTGNHPVRDQVRGSGTGRRRRSVGPSRAGDFTGLSNAGGRHEQPRAHRLITELRRPRHQREAGDRRPHRHGQLRRARGQAGNPPQQPQRGPRRAGQDDAVGGHDLLRTIGHRLIRRRRTPARRGDPHPPGGRRLPVRAVLAAAGPQPLGTGADAHAPSAGLDGLAQRVGEPEQPALDGRVHAPTTRPVLAGPTPLQHRRHSGTERPQLRRGPPQPGHDDIGRQVRRVGRVDARDDGPHEALQDAGPHPRGDE